MNIYVKEFIKRGLMFSGLGPVTAAIVIFIISLFEENLQLDGLQVLIMAVSTYILAFVQAGATVFNQIEHWSVPKSLACHFSSLYAVYILCYLVNTWIPFNINVILTFTAIFVAVFFIIWTVVFLAVRHLSKKLNKNLHGFI